jgi:hypothetical protein
MVDASSKHRAKTSAAAAAKIMAKRAAVSSYGYGRGGYGGHSSSCEGHCTAGQCVLSMEEAACCQPHYAKSFSKAAAKLQHYGSDDDSSYDDGYYRRQPYGRKRYDGDGYGDDDSYGPYGDDDYGSSWLCWH